MEKELFEYKKKVKTLCATISKLELNLENVNNKLEYSNSKCDELSKDNAKLRSIDDDLSKQVY